MRRDGVALGQRRAAGGLFRPLPVVRLAVALFLLAARPAGATRVEGVQFAPVYRTEKATLLLQNAALLRYRVVIKAYVAGLYLGEGVSAEQVLSDVPKRLEIEYFWGIQAADFGRATIEGMRRNVTTTVFESLASRIERLNRIYRDVQPGDRYSLTYLPGVGTELALNGTPLGTIEGADFATGLFSIWLGPEPLDESLKNALLSRR